MEYTNDFVLVEEAADANLSDTASLADVIPEVWGRQVIDYFKDNLVIASLADSMEMSEGDTFHIPKWNDDSITIDSHTEGQDLTVSQMTDAEVTVSPSTYGARLQFSDQVMRRKLSSINLMERGARVLGEKFAEHVEDTVISQLQTDFAISGSNSGQVLDKTGAGTVDAAAVKSLFSEALTKFASNSVPYTPGTIVAVLRPDEYQLLLDDSSFMDAGQFGGREAVLNGEISQYKGIRIVLSNRIATGDDEDADATSDEDIWFITPGYGTLAYLARPRIETQRKPEFLADEVIASMDYGYATVQPERVVRAVFDIA